MRCHPPAGTDFEKRILANEANNQKFNFLKDGDPYNAYYRQKVGGRGEAHARRVGAARECRRCAAALHMPSSAPACHGLRPPWPPGSADAAEPQRRRSSRAHPNPACLLPPRRPPQVADFTAADKGEEAGAPAAAAPAAAPAPAPAPVAPAPEKAKPVLPATKPLEPPEEEQYTVHIPEGLTALDLDTIKLTAQFVARNGEWRGGAGRQLPGGWRARSGRAVDALQGARWCELPPSLVVRVRHGGLLSSPTRA